MSFIDIYEYFCEQPSLEALRLKTHDLVKAAVKHIVSPKDLDDKDELTPILLFLNKFWLQYGRCYNLMVDDNQIDLNRIAHSVNIARLHIFPDHYVSLFGLMGFLGYSSQLALKICQLKQNDEHIEHLIELVTSYIFVVFEFYYSANDKFGIPLI